MDHTEAEDRAEKHIPIDLSQPLILEVHNPNGDITVRAGDRDDVLVGYDAPGLGEDLSDDEDELTIDAHDNRIAIRPNPRVGFGRAGVAGDLDLDAVVGQIAKAFRRGEPRSPIRPGKRRLALGRHVWSDVVIEIPRAITGRVEVHTVSGDLRVEGVSAAIALQTMSGDVHAVRTSGDLELQTASGDLVIEGATGRVTAQTASGDVRVTTARSDGFQIETANGDIRLDVMLAGNGPYRAQTASGDVRLTLRPTAGGTEPAATLAFHTISGEAHVPPPFRKTARRLWQAGEGEPGPRIEISTVSGDLFAEFAAADGDFVAARPSAATEPAPPAASWPRAEPDVAATNAGPEAAQPTAHGEAARLAVLEAVERGEIDVEEALRRLDAADASSDR